MNKIDFFLVHLTFYSIGDLTYLLENYLYVSKRCPKQWNYHNFRSTNICIVQKFECHSRLDSQLAQSQLFV